MNIEVIIQVIIPILGAILIYIIAPYIKKKTTYTQRQDIYFYVKLIVNAVEQVLEYEMPGYEKKKLVMSKLKESNIDISEEELDIMIEAAVKEMNDFKVILK